VELAKLPAESQIYLDANIWIYALEGHATYIKQIHSLFARIDAGEILAITSGLTLAEVLVKPFADSNTALQEIYLEALQDRPGLRIIPLARAILIEAARLRAQHAALKMPDAIHAATAVTSGTRYFLSNDQRFATVVGLERVDINS
jgi:predicted nucleic acid-binding protein